MAMYETAHHKGDLSKHSFLVTGGAGFIGSHIVEYLLKHGAGKVRVLDNYLTGKTENVQPFLIHPAFEMLEGSITDASVCKKACEGITYVSHQAALGSVPRSIADPQNTHLNNVDGFINMLLAAKDAGVKTFVYASSSSVYGDEPSLPKVENRIGQPLSPYSVSKCTNELYANVFHRTYGMKTVGLRYFNIFGPRQDPNGMYAAVIPRFIAGILTQQEVFIDGDGEQTRDFTFVENAVQANIHAMLCENQAAFGQVFNIACGEKYSVNELYNSIRELLGSQQNATYRETRAGDIRNSLADISKAEKLLSYHPQFQFEKGLKLTVDYFKQS